MSVRVVLLCEDQQMATFIRRFLRRFGWERHEMREVIAPPGQGSGEQWVRERYPQELTVMRSRSGVTLVVGTDADDLTVADRVASLDRRCREVGVEARSNAEAVVVVVPKRNIETWLAYLRGEQVDEASTYPRYLNEADCRGEVRVLAEMCEAGRLRAPAPPSLEAACGEYARMK